MGLLCKFYHQILATVDEQLRHIPLGESLRSCPLCSAIWSEALLVVLVLVVAAVFILLAFFFGLLFFPPSRPAIKC